MPPPARMMVRPLLRTRHAAPNRGAKLLYTTGQSGRWSEKTVPVSGWKKDVVPAGWGEGLNSQRNPGVMVSREETCHVSCTHTDSSVTSACVLRAGDLLRSRVFGAEIDRPARAGTVVESHRETLEAQGEPVDLGAAELVQGGRIVIAPKERRARAERMVDTRRAGIELRPADVAAAPEG